MIYPIHFCLHLFLDPDENNSSTKAETCEVEVCCIECIVAMGKRAFIDLESPGETAFGTTSSDAESAAKRARGDVGYLGQDRGQQSHRKRSNSNSSNDSEAENASASPALSSSSRSHSISTINSLSDEILLHILNFLPTHYLISCEQYVKPILRTTIRKPAARWKLTIYQIVASLPSSFL